VRETPRLRVNAVEPGFNPGTGLSRDASVLLRLLNESGATAVEAFKTTEAPSLGSDSASCAVKSVPLTFTLKILALGDLEQHWVPPVHGNESVVAARRVIGLVDSQEGKLVGLSHRVVACHVHEAARTAGSGKAARLEKVTRPASAAVSSNSRAAWGSAPTCRG
jgi:hypothetical protein